MADAPDPFSEPFGTIFGDTYSVARNDGNGYVYSGDVEPVAPLELHPGTHVLHYGSACFEGLKAHRQIDGGVAIFRLDDHAKRFVQSIALMNMPVPEVDLVATMIVDAVAANQLATPEPPGSLYLRPTVIGTLRNIGAAASPSPSSIMYVLTSPVGDYFAGGVRPLSLLIETEIPRTTPQFGMIKTGANYAMALGPTLDAKRDHGIDQVLFATGGDITETGASNFFLVDDDRLITRHLDASFLHGITRASVLQMAADLGYEVEERALDVAEILDWAKRGEMFLSGTAAVIAPVGTLISEGRPISVGDGQPGPNTLRIRDALTSIQIGKSEDPHGWRTPIT